MHLHQLSHQISQMMALFNASERTVAEFATILTQTGWKLERVFRSGDSDIENAKLLAVPVDIPAN